MVHAEPGSSGPAESIGSLPLGGSIVTAEGQPGPFNPLTSFNLLVRWAQGVFDQPLGGKVKGQRHIP